MIARHKTFINEPLPKQKTILYLFCPNEPPFKQTYEPHRKTKDRNMCILAGKKEGKKSKREKKNEKPSCNMWGCSGGGWH